MVKIIIFEKKEYKLKYTIENLEGVNKFSDLSKQQIKEIIEKKASELGYKKSPLFKIFDRGNELTIVFYEKNKSYFSKKEKILIISKDPKIPYDEFSKIKQQINENDQESLRKFLNLQVYKINKNGIFESSLQSFDYSYNQKNSVPKMNTEITINSYEKYNIQNEIILYGGPKGSEYLTFFDRKTELIYKINEKSILKEFILPENNKLSNKLKDEIIDKSEQINTKIKNLMFFIYLVPFILGIIIWYLIIQENWNYLLFSLVIHFVILCLSMILIEKSHKFKNSDLMLSIIQILLIISLLVGLVEMLVQNFTLGIGNFFSPQVICLNAVIIYTVSQIPVNKQKYKYYKVPENGFLKVLYVFDTSKNIFMITDYISYKPIKYQIIDFLGNKQEDNNNKKINNFVVSIIFFTLIMYLLYFNVFLWLVGVILLIILYLNLFKISETDSKVLNITFKIINLTFFVYLLSFVYRYWFFLASNFNSFIHFFAYILPLIYFFSLFWSKHQKFIGQTRLIIILSTLALFATILSFENEQIKKNIPNNYFYSSQDFEEVDGRKIHNVKITFNQKNKIGQPFLYVVNEKFKIINAGPNTTIAGQSIIGEFTKGDQILNLKLENKSESVEYIIESILDYSRNAIAKTEVTHDAINIAKQIEDSKVITYKIEKQKKNNILDLLEPQSVFEIPKEYTFISSDNCKNIKFNEITNTLIFLGNSDKCEFKLRKSFFEYGKFSPSDKNQNIFQNFFEFIPEVIFGTILITYVNLIINKKKDQTQ